MIGPLPCQSARLRAALRVLHWSGHDLANASGHNERTVRRWVAGAYEAPADLVAWVEVLAAFHEAVPAPRARQGCPH